MRTVASSVMCVNDVLRFLIVLLLAINTLFTAVRSDASVLKKEDLAAHAHGVRHGSHYMKLNPKGEVRYENDFDKQQRLKSGYNEKQKEGIQSLERSVERERGMSEIKPYQEEFWGAESDLHWHGDEPLPCSANTCQSDVEMSKMIRIMQIKDQILKQTGLEAPPNMTGVVISQSPVVQDLINSMNMQSQETKKSPDKDGDPVGDDPNIRQEKMFLTATEGPAWIKIPEGRKIHYFSLGREHPSSIALANLHIWLRSASNSNSKDHEALVSVYKVEPAKEYYNRLISIVTDFSVTFKSSGTWIKVDIFSLVREWLTDPGENLGFVIKVHTVGGASLDVETSHDDPAHAPLLELDVKEERNDRKKRFANNRVCSDKKVEKECCRYPLTVNFLMYNLDFIVAPKKYVANYCRGECPFLYAHKIPHITMLQQMFPNSTAASHGPCCGARDLAPLKMVYYDGRKIKIGVINDMVVKQCSCN